MIKESIVRDVGSKKRETVVAVKEKPKEVPFDASRVIPLVEVSNEEFVAFLEAYPCHLSRNFFMDWLDFHDFSIDGFPPYCCVARKYCGFGEFKYYISAEGITK